MVREDQYDTFLSHVLRRVGQEFARVVTGNRQLDLPAELTWVLVKALVTEKNLTLNQAGRVVLDYCERNGDAIPDLLRHAVTGPDMEDPQTSWGKRGYQH